jgi:hypothetical protein
MTQNPAAKAHLENGKKRIVESVEIWKTIRRQGTTKYVQTHNCKNQHEQ